MKKSNKETEQKACDNENDALPKIAGFSVRRQEKKKIAIKSEEQTVLMKTLTFPRSLLHNKPAIQASATTTKN